MRTLLLAAAAVLFTLPSDAQTAKKKQDIEAIKSMCGCYEVEFNFAETFVKSKDKEYKSSAPKYDYALEWVELLNDTQDKVVLQHLLIVSDTMIVKHWRQDWEFENTYLYNFEKDKTWKYETMPKSAVKGQWTQRVYQVDDSPRYEGSATWTHVDGTHRWQNTTDAPLPRRERARKDYNVLQRTNVHEITKDGWIHDQDNIKINRNEKGQGEILAYEKGYDTYKKVADSKCKAAQKYWVENAALWKNVRTKWQTVYDRKKDLNLQKSVEHKPLFMHLFDLPADASKETTDKIIDSFVKS